MVNSGEALLNGVTKAKRKMLNRLDQKVRGQVRCLWPAGLYFVYQLSKHAGRKSTI
jgi:hypothetical protein